MPAHLQVRELPPGGGRPTCCPPKPPEDGPGGFEEIDMSCRTVYFNGEFVSEREARVSIFDSALMFGDMVFDMTRTYGQKPFRLKEHLERIYAGLKYLEIDCGLTIEEIASVVEIGTATVNRDLAMARAWLRRELES